MSALTSSEADKRSSLTAVGSAEDGISELVDRESRPYDVLVLGATGTAGKWMVRYLAERSVHSSVKWAIAGRSLAKLTSLVADTNKWLKTSQKFVRDARRGSFGRMATLSADSELEEDSGDEKADGFEVERIVADVMDEESLSAALRCTRLVLNCVGPFRFFGDNVVRLCAELGTHYVDICGEPEFMEQSTLRYFEKCRGNGTFIVNACGFDSVPADIGQMYLSQVFAASGGLCQRIECYQRQHLADGYTVNSATFKAALHGFANVAKVRAIRKALEGVDFRATRKSIRRSGRKQVVFGSGKGADKNWPIFWSEKLERYCTIFPFADSAVVGNSQGISQSLADASGCHSQPSAQFACYLVFENYWELLRLATVGILMRTLGPFAPLRDFMVANAYWCSLGAFSDGGPTDAQIEASRFESVHYAYGYSHASADGSEEKDCTDRCLKLTVAGADAGYKGTAVMAVECALCLLEQMPVILEGDAEKGIAPLCGGVFTPAAVFANTSLVETLERSGITFTLETIGSDSDSDGDLSEDSFSDATGDQKEEV